LGVLDLGQGTGPHYLRLTRDEKRLVVTDYFLVEDITPGGVVQVEGDHKIHVINATRTASSSTRISTSISITTSAPARPGRMEWSS
jgi:hypothetical protein